MKNMFCKTAYLLLFLSASLSLPAQNLSPTVVGSGGDTWMDPGLGSLHWTLGEPMVETYASGNVLTQGFHQVYYDLLVSVGPEPPDDLQLNVYPNPTNGWVVVEVAPLPPDLMLEVHNLLGQRVMLKNITQEIQTLYLDHFAPGVYVFTFRNDAFIYRTVLVEKVIF